MKKEKKDAEAVEQPEKNKPAESGENNGLEQEKSELEREKEELYDKLLRSQAELENFRKRLTKETAAKIRYANKSLMSELLPVIDNFERAVDSSLSQDDISSLKEGVELTLKQIKDVLFKAGLVEINTLGEKFDPSRHEAVMQLESDKHEHNTVIEEHQRGYFLYDQILRPAMVTVAKGKK
ncbi:MAG: nucleotide exchange factor GrpE [bacterium]